MLEVEAWGHIDGATRGAERKQRVAHWARTVTGGGLFGPSEH